MPVKETTAAESFDGRKTERMKLDAAACSSFKTFSCEAEVSTSRASESGASVSCSNVAIFCSTPSSVRRRSSGRSVVTNRRFWSVADSRSLVRSVSMRSTGSASSGVGVGDGLGVGVGVGVGLGS